MYREEVQAKQSRHTVKRYPPQAFLQPANIAQQDQERSLIFVQSISYSVDELVFSIPPSMMQKVHSTGFA
ncbi:hypothetical protein OH492_04855 [Vibrio chagasii]|nr:hypothetical protein [Vibrio chagasii]